MTFCDPRTVASNEESAEIMPSSQRMRPERLSICGPASLRNSRILPTSKARQERGGLFYRMHRYDSLFITATWRDYRCLVRNSQESVKVRIILGLGGWISDDRVTTRMSGVVRNFLRAILRKRTRAKAALKQELPTKGSGRSSKSSPGTIATDRRKITRTVDDFLLYRARKRSLPDFPAFYLSHATARLM